MNSSLCSLYKRIKRRWARSERSGLLFILLMGDWKFFSQAVGIGSFEACHSEIDPNKAGKRWELGLLKLVKAG